MVTLLALLLSGAVIGGLGEAERTATSTDSAPEGFDSTTVTELQDELPQREGSAAIVLFSKDSGTWSPSDLGALEKAYGELVAAQVGEAAAGSGGPPEGAGPGLQVSADKTAALGVVPILEADEVRAQKAVEKLRKDAAGAVPSGVTAQVTGPAAIKADLAKVFEGADLTLLMVTGAVVILLLLLTYRSPLLWIVPFVTVALADRTAVVVATQVMGAFDMRWDASTTGILSVLVFGAGTNYALLLISRYRDELRNHENRFEAMSVAWRGSIEAIATAASTVLLGLLTLLLSVVPATRGLGLACSVGIFVAAVFVSVVLPCFLVLFPRGIFWPIVPRVGEAGLAGSRGFWRRIGDTVATRPAVFATGTLLLLALLAAGTTQIRTGLSQSEQFLDTPESIVAAERLSESFPAGSSNPTIVMTRASAEEAARAAADTPGVASAVATVSGPDLSRVDVVLDAGSGTDEAEDAIVALRESLSAYDETWVGGAEAESLDEGAAAEQDRTLIVPLVLGLVLVTLMLLLRSVMAPILLVATVVGTYFAALGASWWIFTGPLGFERLDVGVPLFAFIFLVALGVDYNIFLVSRAASEARGHGVREGMLRGLAATGGVITSAGILLAAVFAALGVLPLVVLAQLGLIICLGVLLDTLVVRTVLVPALALVLGDRFWWPRRVVGR